MQVSVIIPTLNAAEELPATLHALTNGAVDGVIREVIIADGGSRDETLQIADSFGATLCIGDKGRGSQLKAGARLARSEWLLFLHCDTVLGGDWIDDVRRFIHGDSKRAGVFRLQFDEKGFGPMMVAAGAMFRTRFFCLPFGDQGLLISRRRYNDIGGYQDMILFEDVDIIKRLRRDGRQNVQVLNSPAVTSAKRYRQEGYFARVIRNFICVMMYQLGIPITHINAFYERKLLKR